MAPDYTWWHEVSKHFYLKLIPEALKHNDSEVNILVETIMSGPMHNLMQIPTGDIKADINLGEMRKVYEKLMKKNK